MCGCVGDECEMCEGDVWEMCMSDECEMCVGDVWEMCMAVE